jgi:Domain of unknown function (DUF3859)
MVPRGLSFRGDQMKFLAIVSLVLFASYPAIAQVQVTNVEVLDYGIYTVDVKTSRRDSQGINENLTTSARLAKATTTVPAERGVEFGIRYKIDGAPVGTVVSLRELTIFPAPGMRPPSASQPVHISRTTTTPRIGDVSYTGYRLDDPWELLPGVWVIQLWYGDRKVAQQNFTVIAPASH